MKKIKTPGHQNPNYKTSTSGLEFKAGQKLKPQIKTIQIKTPGAQIRTTTKEKPWEPRSRLRTNK